MENCELVGDSFVDKLVLLVRRQGEECPLCGDHVEHLVEHDGNVYAQPCRCQLWHGRVPASWWNHAPDLVAIKQGNVVRILAADENNGRLATVIASPPGAVTIPEGCVWVEFCDHPKGARYRLYYSSVDLVAPKSLNR